MGPERHINQQPEKLPETEQEPQVSSRVLSEIEEILKKAKQNAIDRERWNETRGA